jgi:rhamnosyltransferase
MSQSATSTGDFLEPNPENICAIFIAYFPDTQFSERLEKMRRQVAKILVVDNTPGGTGLGASLHSQNGLDIEVIENRANLGVGAALNQGFARAIQLGYRWVVTFDQDSWAQGNLISTLAGIIKRQSRQDRLGIVGCNFEDQNLNAPAVKPNSVGPDFLEPLTVITSGSLMSTEVFSAVGPFRQDFFIDFIDHEYCLRLRKRGYSVLMSTAPLMTHALGAAEKLGTGITGHLSLVLTNRPPIRRYYMARNCLLVAKEYFMEAPIWTVKAILSTLVFAALKIPFEKTDRSKKFRATLYGAWQGIRGKAGAFAPSWLAT